MVVAVVVEEVMKGRGDKGQQGRAECTCRWPRASDATSLGGKGHPDRLNGSTALIQTDRGMASPGEDLRCRTEDEIPEEHKSGLIVHSICGADQCSTQVVDSPGISRFDWQ